jgi:hypothetical protein
MMDKAVKHFEAIRKENDMLRADMAAMEKPRHTLH